MSIDENALEKAIHVYWDEWVKHAKNSFQEYWALRQACLAYEAAKSKAGEGDVVAAKCIHSWPGKRIGMVCRECQEALTHHEAVHRDILFEALMAKESYCYNQAIPFTASMALDAIEGCTTSTPYSLDHIAYQYALDKAYSMATFDPKRNEYVLGGTVEITNAAGTAIISYLQQTHNCTITQANPIDREQNEN